MCFLLAFVFSWLNLSYYMGAFFAGSMIASTKYYTDVSLYIKPLSNLFFGGILRIYGYDGRSH
ncbi:hypothetical protein [Candidatus Methanoliparum sp. LAM-1]